MKLIITFLLTSSLLLPWAAHAEGDDVITNTRNDLLLVAAAGAGGAVLGLSTLSFYDKPSKNLSNIWMGAALGIIGGVIFVAINHAQKTQGDLAQASENFSTLERLTWHDSQLAEQVVSSTSIPSAQLWSKDF